MISRVSIIATLENGSTKTACISIKDRKINRRDTKALSARQFKYIVPYKNEFTDLKIISEMQTGRKGKVYKVCYKVQKWENLAEDILDMINVCDHMLMLGIYDGVIPSIW